MMASAMSTPSRSAASIKASRRALSRSARLSMKALGAFSDGVTAKDHAKRRVSGGVWIGKEDKSKLDDNSNSPLLAIDDMAASLFLLVTV